MKKSKKIIGLTQDRPVVSDATLKPEIPVKLPKEEIIMKPTKPISPTKVSKPSPGVIRKRMAKEVEKKEEEEEKPKKQKTDE